MIALEREVGEGTNVWRGWEGSSHRSIRSLKGHFQHLLRKLFLDYSKSVSLRMYLKENLLKSAI